MARISEKALRPRQYVFNRLSSERISALAPGVRKLREHERRQMLHARASRRAAERHMAARHAENIMAGITDAIPESDEIGELERELDELRTRKRQLFEQLRETLKQESEEAGTSAGQGQSHSLVLKRQPSSSELEDDHHDHHDHHQQQQQQREQREREQMTLDMEKEKEKDKDKDKSKSERDRTKSKTHAQTQTPSPPPQTHSVGSAHGHGHGHHGHEHHGQGAPKRQKTEDLKVQVHDGGRR